MYQVKKKNLRVLANAYALISKTLERVEGIENKREGDRSLVSDDVDLKQAQHLGHLMLAERIRKEIGK